MTGDRPRIDVDTSLATPSPARMYDYFLGGKDHYQVDREAAEEALAAAPEIRALARENRAFLQRAVQFLAAEVGIRQFVDLGTGLPTKGNVHEVAQQAVPDARVVYVDYDHAETRPQLVEAARTYDRATSKGVPRSREEIHRLFEGFELVEPGLVRLPEWHPEPPGEVSVPEEASGALAGVGRKP